MNTYNPNWRPITDPSSNEPDHGQEVLVFSSGVHVINAVYDSKKKEFRNLVGGWTNPTYWTEMIEKP